MYIAFFILLCILNMSRNKYIYTKKMINPPLTLTIPLPLPEVPNPHQASDVNLLTPPLPPFPPPQSLSSRARHGDARAPGALVPLRRDDHVVERAERHPGALPRVEEVARGDGPAGPLALADGPVLLEGGGPLDGGGVGARRLVQVVGAAVGGDAALGLGARRGARVVGAEVLEDVVLDQGGGGPAVDAEVLGFFFW